ncbi:MAG: ribonuclease P protein component [Gemmatimonadales bacterium]
MERFPRARRLARPSDIRHCLQHGRRFRTEHLEVIWVENTAGHPRMGLIVPRFQSSAVARNRLRRRLREIWRREVLPAQPPWDVLVRTRPSAYRVGFRDLRDQLVLWRTTVLSGG